MAPREAKAHDVLRNAFYSLWGVLTLVLFFTVGFLVMQLSRVNEDAEMRDAVTKGPFPVASDAAPETGQTVTLYFADPTAIRLLPEQRPIPLTDSTVENCRKAFTSLAEGPRTTAAPVLPPTASLRALYLLPTGELVVDLARDVESPQTQSVGAEWLLVQAIAHTLTQPAIQGPQDRPVTSLRLLFEGSPVADTFPSHISLRDELRPDPRMLAGE
jgi:hypothetical protein